MPYELDIVHPATAEWLTTNGYTFRHEAKLFAGIVDFIAYKDGQVFAVEAKSSLLSSDFPLSVNQVMGYARQIQIINKLDAIPCLSAPSQCAFDHHIDLCAKLGIRVILVECISDTEYLKMKKRVDWSEWNTTCRKMRGKIIDTAI